MQILNLNMFVYTEDHSEQYELHCRIDRAYECV